MDFHGFLKKMDRKEIETKRDHMIICVECGGERLKCS